MAKNANRDKSYIKNKINIFLNNYFNKIAFIFFIMLLIAGYFFLIRPKYTEIVTNAQTNKAGEEAEYEKQSKYLAQLEELKKKFDEIDRKDVEKIAGILPYEKNHEILFAKIEKMITQNGYILNSLSIDAGDSGRRKSAAKKEAAESEEEAAPVAEKSGEIKKISLKMSIKGTDYNGLKKLLAAIENNLRLMDVNNLSFDPAGNSLSLDLTAYFLE